MIYKELDCIKLLNNYDEKWLKKWEVWTILIVHQIPRLLYETEFIFSDWKTKSIVLLFPDQVELYYCSNK